MLIKKYIESGTIGVEHAVKWGITSPGRVKVRA